MTPPLPEVRVVHGFGLDIEAARTTRVRVDDQGDLVVARPGGAARVVASAADVRQVVWLDGPETARIFGSPLTRLFLRVNRRAAAVSADGVPIWLASGSCVVLTDRGPVVSWLVDETAPGTGDASTRRQQSGSVALARGLGLTLEASPPGTAVDRRAVRRSAVRWTGARPWIGAASSVALLASLVLAALSWGGFDGDDVAVQAVLALVLVLPVAIATLVLRRRAMRLMTTPPDPADRGVHRPAPLADHDLAHLQLGPHDVVVVSGDGTETWLPGPAVVGGVARIQVVHDQLRMLDARDGLVDLVPTDRFAPDGPSCDALVAAASRAGITVDVLDPPPGVVASPRVSAVVASGGWHTGDISPLQVWLLGAAGLFVVVAGFATGQQHALLGPVVSAGGAVVVGNWVWGRWSLRRWIRSVERETP
ncbi:MAG: hypothetical protein ABW075_07120 [Aeromicrobium sp.]